MTFRIPVVHGKNLDIGSAHSRNLQRVVARRAAEERVDVPLVLVLIHVGKEPPL